MRGLLLAVLIVFLQTGCPGAGSPGADSPSSSEIPALPPETVGPPDAPPGALPEPPTVNSDPLPVPKTSIYPSCQIKGSSTDINPGLLVSAGTDSAKTSSAVLPWYFQREFGINIAGAWAITRGSKNLTIAVIDDGFLPNSPAFKTGTCSAKTTFFDLTPGKRKQPPSDHGAAVSSLISDCQGNSLGIQPINTESPVLWLEAGELTTGAITASLAWAIGENSCLNSKHISCNQCNESPARIINASLGFHFAGISPKFIRQLYLPVVELINSRGSMLVAAAGNDSISADTHVPSNLPGVISVGATDADGTSAGFSNWGETVEAMAPGSNIIVAGPLGPELASGNSFSAPMGTATLSYLATVYPKLNWKTAIYFLQSTARPMNCNSYCSANYDTYKNVPPDFLPDPRKQCQKDCCGGSPTGPQVCTPGRINAAAAVALAKKAQEQGLALAAPVALIDSNRYWVRLGDPIAPDYLYHVGEFTLKNMGGATGSYSITSPGGKIAFDKSSITISPGESITITAKTTSAFIKYSDEAPIRIASPSSRNTPAFSDELTIYASWDSAR